MGNFAERIDQWLYPVSSWGGRERRKHAMRALVIEDDECQEPVLRRALAQACPGIQVDWVDSAEAALKRIRRQAYDLIVADIFLRGGQSGLEFWAQCQELVPDTQVLFTSAMPVETFTRSFGGQAICPPFLQKPFRFGECAQAIEELLGYAARGRRD